MAETIRTKSELLTIFADNITGDITPQDLRDFVVSNQVAETQSEGSAGTTVNELSDIYFADTGNTDATLPTTVAYGNRLLTVANGSGGIFTLNASGGNTINGSSSISIDDEQFAQMTPDGTDWIVIVNTSGGAVPPHTHVEVDITDLGTYLESVSSDATLTGSGTPGDPLTVVSVFGSEFQAEEKDVDQSTSSTSFQQYQRMTTPSLPSGVYKIEFISIHTSNSQSRSVSNRLQINDTLTLFGGEEFNKEGRDGDSNQREHFSGSDYYTHTGGPVDIDLDFRRSKGSGAVIMRYSNISIHRVS